jgi:hypothetical protein
MAKYTTTSGQTIFDLSLQLYGDASSAVKIINDNPALGSISGTIPPGTVVEYTPREGFTVAQYFADNKATVNTGTGNPLQGSGFDLGFEINGFN